MVPISSEDSQKSSSFRVRFVAKALSIYHMILCIVFFIEHSLEMLKRKNFYQEITKYCIIEACSSYLLLTVLFIISACLLRGDLKNKASLILPFLTLQVMAFVLGVLVLCSFYIEVPSYLRNKGKASMTIHTSKLPLSSAFNMFLSLLTLCSSYSEVPAYLNLESINHMNYFPEVTSSSPRYITELISFNFLHVAVIIYKASLIYSIWKLFEILRNMKKPKSDENNQPKAISNVILPSYDEAIKASVNDCPPPYSVL